MYDSVKSVVQNLMVLLLVLLSLSSGTTAQTLRVESASVESKLSQKTCFVPQSAFALERLIEVAQYYQVPMGIEWVGQSNIGVLKPLYPSRRTVRSLIATILEQLPGYRVRVENGVVNIARADAKDAPKNFLNLKIPQFQVDQANLYDANALLRLKINMTLHPERYRGGVGGGYGYGVPGEDSFDANSITFSGHNLTVREILNKIVATNANALWVVQLVPSKTMISEPFFAQGPLDVAGRSPLDFHWQFVPLDKTRTTR